MIFRASDDKNEIGRASAHPSTRKVAGASKELLEDANPGGFLCVHCYFLLTSPLISETAQATYMSRLFCMGKRKGNSWKIGGLIAGKQWGTFPDWVGFGDVDQTRH